MLAVGGGVADVDYVAVRSFLLHWRNDSSRTKQNLKSRPQNNKRFGHALQMQTATKNLSQNSGTSNAKNDETAGQIKFRERTKENGEEEEGKTKLFT